MAAPTQPFTTTQARRHRILLLAYGVAASIWKVVVGLTLMIGASAMFHGAGIVLGVIGLIVWFGMPLQNAMKTLRNQFYESRPAFFSSHYGL